MNEQIRELWHKAAIDTHQNESTSWENEVKFIEKFAELIVRECVEYYRSQIGETSEPHTKTLEYFGVES